MHYAIRALINKAADDDGLDPDPISFTNTVHATGRNVRARISRSITLARATQRAIAELLHTTLPPRRQRSTARVIGRKMSKWHVKRAAHRNWSQPQGATIHVLHPT